MSGLSLLRGLPPLCPARATAAPRLRQRCATTAAARQEAPTRPLDLCFYTLILDDIVFPDGRTAMAQLGGGGPQAAWGARLHRSSPRVGLAAGVGGGDLPPACVEWLRAAEVDTAGLLPGADTPTPRAWQVLEADGRRTEVWRTACEPATLRPPPAALPPHFRAAAAYHLGVHPSRPELPLLQQLRDAAAAAAAAAAGGADGAGGAPSREREPPLLLSIEPFTAADAPLSEGELRALLRLCDVFSPNEAEARSMLGCEPGTLALEVVARLASLGARVVALRRGERGAIVHSAETGETWDIPAVAGVKPVDPTGCGNAFCGAFLAALRSGDSLQAAGLWGCVAASFVLEAQGVPRKPPQKKDVQKEAARRLEALAPRARQLAAPRSAA